MPKARAVPRTYQGATHQKARRPPMNGASMKQSPTDRARATPPRIQTSSGLRMGLVVSTYWAGSSRASLMRTGNCGISPMPRRHSVLTFAILSTASMPAITRPKTQ